MLHCDTLAWRQLYIWTLLKCYKLKELQKSQKSIFFSLVRIFIEYKSEKKKEGEKKIIQRGKSGESGNMKIQTFGKHRIQNLSKLFLKGKVMNSATREGI